MAPARQLPRSGVTVWCECNITRLHARSVRNGSRVSLPKPPRYLYGFHEQGGSARRADLQDEGIAALRLLARDLNSGE